MTGNRHTAASLSANAPCCLSLLLCRTKTNMASSADVHVRICGQEIIKYDLEIKALIQVRAEKHGLSVYLFID